MASELDEYTKANLRFKFLVYPSEDPSLVEGFEQVFVSLSDKGDQAPRTTETLWAGNGQEPEKYEFILDFNKFNKNPTGNQIQVVLANGGYKEVPIYTTVIPEIRKEICYYGPSYLMVTFFSNPDEDHLVDYKTAIKQEWVPSGTCKDFYLIYNIDYFYELGVVTSDPHATGVIGNWDQDKFDSTGDGFVYDYRIYDANPIRVTGKLYGSGEEASIDLTWQSVSPGTIWVY